MDIGDLGFRGWIPAFDGEFGDCWLVGVGVEVSVRLRSMDFVFVSS